MSTSLDILKPAPWVITREKEQSEEAKDLEKLSITMIEAASDQDFAHPVWERLSSNFVGEFDYAKDQTPVKNWETFVKHHRSIRRKYPEYHFEVVNSCADVHERNGTASVYVLLKVTGFPSTLERASILVMRWRRHGESWHCYREGVLRGLQWHE